LLYASCWFIFRLTVLSWRWTMFFRNAQLHPNTRCYTPENRNLYALWSHWHIT
jgi:hypothetical protein